MRVLCVVSIAALLCASAASAAGELSGRRAPGFALFDITDPSLKMHDLYDYRGRIVVLEFMQTTCPHCQRLAQTLERVKAKYGDRVAILSISNPPDNQSTVANYRAKLNVTTPILYDCGQVVSSYMKATPQNPRISIPHLFLIDAAGMIRNDFAYELLTREIFEGEGLVQELDRMLGGPDATTPSTTAPKKKR